MSHAEQHVDDEPQAPRSLRQRLRATARLNGESSGDHHHNGATNGVDLRPLEPQPIRPLARMAKAMARGLTLVGLRTQELKQTAGAAVTAARSRIDLRRPVERDYAPAMNFDQLPFYVSLSNHRKITKRFDFTEPFYRCYAPDSGAHVKINGKSYLHFSSYDYLGLNRHPAVSQAAKSAIETYGTTVSASRIVSGEIELHRELERALAEFYQTEDAVTFVSGHGTNVSTIATLVGPGDLIVHDELAHNSVITGARLSGATVRPFRHNDMAALKRLLDIERGRHKNALIVVEGLYSMDGDIPDLPRLIELKQHYGSWLMVDEAHGLGVLGKNGEGIAEHYGVDPRGVDVWMGTLSKSLAACGGYVAGSAVLIQVLKYNAASQVYSVGMSPPVAAAALAALKVLKAEPERVARLQGNGRLFLSEAKRLALDTVTSAGYAIVPIMVGDIVRVGRITDRLLARGISVMPIIYPAVPLKACRLRFFLTSMHTEDEIRHAVQATAEELRKLA